MLHKISFQVKLTTQVLSALSSVWVTGIKFVFRLGSKHLYSLSPLAGLRYGPFKTDSRCFFQNSFQPSDTMLQMLLQVLADVPVMCLW